MAESRGVIKLSDILEQFQDTTEKLAADDNAAPDTEELPELQATKQEQEKVKEQKAQEGPKDLQQLADEAVETFNSSVQKEASEFGRIFADSFLDEVQTVQSVEKCAQDAYVAATEFIENAEAEEYMPKIAEEAYKAASDYIQHQELSKMASYAYDATTGRIMSKIAEDAYLQTLEYTHDSELQKVASDAYEATLAYVAQQG